jgi:hypothetical protein
MQAMLAAAVPKDTQLPLLMCIEKAMRKQWGPLQWFF